MDDSTPTVAVVGGGASGTLYAIHLLRTGCATNRPVRLLLVERTGEFGPGVAYRTADRRHLLNTPAGRISAFADDPDHFTRWATVHGKNVTTGDFLPRGLYGRYLTDVLAATVLAAADRAEVRRIGAEVVAVAARGGEPVRLCLDGGGDLRADHVVLALGNPPPDRLPGSACQIADPWAPGALDRVSGARSVLLVGTGLTMVDIALTITGGDADVEVHAMSRHGLLPQPHMLPAGPLAELPGAEDVTDLRGLLRLVRGGVAVRPDRWREVVDGLRPHTQRLWRQLDVVEQQRFIHRVGRYWEVHRHRVSPGAAARMEQLRRQGRVHVHRGRLSAVEELGGGVVAAVDGPHGSSTLHGDWLINCTGFTGDVTASGNALLRQMFATGTARPDPLRLGVDTDDRGHLVGATGVANPRLCTLGPTRHGTLFETTAIPEIRTQAAELARRTWSALDPVAVSH